MESVPSLLRLLSFLPLAFVHIRGLKSNFGLFLEYSTAVTSRHTFCFRVIYYETQRGREIKKGKGRWVQEVGMSGETRGWWLGDGAQHPSRLVVRSVRLLG